VRRAPDFDDASWKPVTLPRAWNEDEAFKVDIHDLKGAIVWYRKRIVLPADVGPAVGGKAFIEFEGVRQAGDVYVNGVLVGGHENGVTAFGVDATKALKPAPFVNVVAVRVDSDWKYKERATGSGFQWNNDNFNVNYGGIHRAVRLHLTGACTRPCRCIPAWARPASMSGPTGSTSRVGRDGSR
jgi:beta-galactosidase